MKQAVVMASGGLDSTTICYQLIKDDFDVLPLFFDYGQHCVELEWKRLNDVLPKDSRAPDRVDVSDVFKGSNSRMIVEADLWTDPITADDLYIPYRTLLFYSLAAARAQTVGVPDVYSGFLNSNHVKEVDCGATFLNGLGELAEGVGTIRFHLPYRNLTKADVVKQAVNLHVPIGRTFSCQAQSSFPCGACPNCVERLNALQEAGIT